jgi:diacylglycerol kinase family enzyme
MYAAPDALLDDGLLEVVTMEHMSRWRFLSSVLPKVFKGTHVELPAVRVFRAAEVTISADRPFTMYADGDPIGELPVRVRAVKGAVNVIVPLEGPAAPAFAAPHPAAAHGREGESAPAASLSDESPVSR